MVLWVQPYGAIALFQCAWEILRCSIYYHKIYYHKNEQLNFHMITLQIPSCKAPNRFQESYNVKYVKAIKRLKNLQKADAYLESKWASMMELFCEYA